MKELWVEKYRPKTISEYVFRDGVQKAQIETWIKEKSIPQLLLTGAPGTGKTTLAKVLIGELGVDKYDIKEINASRENSIDTIRETISGFIATMPYGDFKVVLLDEADYISLNGQAALRGMIEEYTDSVRFILTANYPNRILPALHSRCQGFHIDKLDKTEFECRVAEILCEEEIQFDLDVLDTYVTATYPDLRKCLNTVQMNSTSGTLIMLRGNESDSEDYKIKVVELFKAGKILEARQTLCSNIRPEDIEGMFRWLYDSLDLFASTEEEKDDAILVIKRAIYESAFVADPEINLSGCIIELTRIGK